MLDVTITVDVPQSLFYDNAFALFSY
jgi:hypothetical protein